MKHLLCVRPTYAIALNSCHQEGEAYRHRSQELCFKRGINLEFIYTLCSDWLSNMRAL